MACGCSISDTLGTLTQGVEVLPLAFLILITFANKSWCVCVRAMLETSVLASHSGNVQDGDIDDGFVSCKMVIALVWCMRVWRSDGSG